MGEHTRPARKGKCKGFKRLIVGRLYCDRETEHPGSHRDDTECVYWIETAPALEYLEVGPPATMPGVSRYPVHWEGDAPTSLHGNGAASFERTTRDVTKVTCRLCLALLDREPSDPSPRVHPAHEARHGHPGEPCRDRSVCYPGDRSNAQEPARG